MKSGFYRSTGRLPEPPGGIWALVGFSGRDERWPGLGCAPLPPSPNRTRREGAGALFLLSLSFPPYESYSNKDWGEVLLPEGVVLLLARPMMAGQPPPLEHIYMEAGAPQIYTS